MIVIGPSNYPKSTRLHHSAMNRGTLDHVQVSSSQFLASPEPVPVSFPHCFELTSQPRILLISPQFHAVLSPIYSLHILLCIPPNSLFLIPQLSAFGSPKVDTSNYSSSLFFALFLFIPLVITQLLTTHNSHGSHTHPHARHTHSDHYEKGERDIPRVRETAEREVD